MRSIRTICGLFSSEGKIWKCLYHFETRARKRDTPRADPGAAPEYSERECGTEGRRAGWAGAQAASHGRCAGGRARAWADLGRTCRHRRCPANVLDSGTGRNGMSLFRALHCFQTFYVFRLCRLMVFELKVCYKFKRSQFCIFHQHVFVIFIDLKLISLEMDLIQRKKKKEGSSGIWTRDLSHPKRESYP